MLPLLLNKIIQTDKLLFLHLVTQKNRIYTFLNPVSYLIALENKSLFEQFDGIFADGSLLVSAIRLVYGKRVTRRSFDMTSLAPELLNYLMESRKTLYIVASGQEQVECSVKIFQEQYPGLRIAGFRNGYFSSDAEMNKEASHIVELNPDFLIVGMPALFTNFRIDRNVVPEGLHAYDIRESDDGGRFATIEPEVMVNHAGTILISRNFTRGRFFDNRRKPLYTPDRSWPGCG